MQSIFQDNLPKIYALLAKRKINMHRCWLRRFFLAVGGGGGGEEGGAFYDKNKRKKIMVIA